VKEDATFKSADELSKIYTEGCGLHRGDNIVAYCRIGERSSHTWFVLTYLLGYEKVRNYDGSWTEWGNKVRGAHRAGQLIDEQRLPRALGRRAGVALPAEAGRDYPSLRSRCPRRRSART